MNPAGRLRGNMGPIGKPYSRMSQPLFDCTRLGLLDILGLPRSFLLWAHISITSKPRHTPGLFFRRPSGPNLTFRFF
jgi:hypothetical protein